MDANVNLLSEVMPKNHFASHKQGHSGRQSSHLKAFSYPLVNEFLPGFPKNNYYPHSLQKITSQCGPVLTGPRGGSIPANMMRTLHRSRLANDSATCIKSTPSSLLETATFPQVNLRRSFSLRFVCEKFFPFRSDLILNDLTTEITNGTHLRGRKAVWLLGERA